MAQTVIGDRGAQIIQGGAMSAGLIERLGKGVPEIAVGVGAGAMAADTAMDTARDAVAIAERVAAGQAVPILDTAFGLGVRGIKLLVEAGLAVGLTADGLAVIITNKKPVAADLFATLMDRTAQNVTDVRDTIGGWLNSVRSKAE